MKFLAAGTLIRLARPVLLNMLDIPSQAGGGDPYAHLGRPEDDGAVMTPSAVHCWQSKQAGGGSRNEPAVLKFSEIASSRGF